MTIDVPNAPNPAKIALIAYEGVQMSAVLGLTDIMQVANRFAAEVGREQVDAGVFTPRQLPPDVAFDAIVLPPSLSGHRGTADAGLHHWIAERHRQGSILCSACAGAFWLGHAGVLNERPVTTHWALEGEFRAAFPKAQLHPEHLIIDDHDIVTAGGVMAWVDLGLFLIRRHHGAEIVSRTCRQMLIDPSGREQRNYRSFRPRLDHGDDRIRVLQLWMEENAGSELSLPVLAAQAVLPERSLQRRFSTATGMPVSRYIQELRIEKARGLLERTNMPVSAICWKVGYSDSSTFSQLFKSICGIGAKEYRRRFSLKLEQG